MQNHSTKTIKFAAIMAVSLFGLAALAGSEAKAQAQTATGFERAAEQAATYQLGSRNAAESNYLTACDMTALGAGSRVGASALCSVRVYGGESGDWQAYRRTFRMTCNESSGCMVEGGH